VEGERFNERVREDGESVKYRRPVSTMERKDSKSLGVGDSGEESSESMGTSMSRIGRRRESVGTGVGGLVVCRLEVACDAWIRRERRRL
jgi:hypothetical protein